MKHSTLQGVVKNFTSTPAKARSKREEKRHLGNADLCLDAVAYEDLEKIFEEIDKDVQLNEKRG